MNDSEEQEALMVRYLLGQSPEEERAQVEERYFSDSEYFEQLLLLEDSLIDDFVMGRMPAEQQRAFNESRPARDDDVRFSRALFHAVTKKNRDRPMPNRKRRLPAMKQPVFALKRALPWAMSFGAIILFALGLGLLFNNITLRNKLSEKEALLEVLREEKEAAEQELGQARSQSESSLRELEIERNKRIDAETLIQGRGRPESQNGSSDSRTIVLTAAFISRGPSSVIKEVPLTENVRWLRFVVPLKYHGEYESYRISIKLAGQSNVFDRGFPKPSGSSRNLVVIVPATNLRPGDYILALYGEEPNAAPATLERYSFRVTN